MTINNHRTSRIKALATIVALLCLLLGTCTVVRESCKIVKTGVTLLVIYNNTDFYNDSPRKTNEMTKRYLEDQAEREKIYQSEDAVIRNFSNLPRVIKLPVLILAMLAIPGVPFLVLLYVLRQVYANQRRRQRQRNQEVKRRQSALN